jgi:high-affinity iron transporter
VLPTFVIGLREGLEAALIVGIIAAFLRQQGRRDLLRWVFVGVSIAVLLCVGVGVALRIVSADLPQRKQEGLETVVGILAVGMVTYMVVWMRQHSRGLKGQLETMAAEAIEGANGSGRAMVVMAFLAVLREGFETVVFLLAVFNQSSNTTEAGTGALLGILVAIALGYGIYRGGVKLNLSKFFRATGAVLVLVAAGLVVTAFHTAHEAGWVNYGQGATLDLSWLVKPGSVQSSLLTGMLGIQPRPVTVEVIGWLVYLIPVGLYVVWPPGKGLSHRNQLRLFGAIGAAGAIAAVTVAVAAPGSPAVGPTAGTRTVSLSAAAAVLDTPVISPAAATGSRTAPAAPVPLKYVMGTTRRGVEVVQFAGRAPGAGAAGRPPSLSVADLAALNNGRLPTGLGNVGLDSRVSVHYRDVNTLNAWIEPRTGRVVDLRWDEKVTATVDSTNTRIGTLPLDRPVAMGARAWPAATSAAQAAAARANLDDIDSRQSMHTLAWWLGGLALLAGLFLLGGILGPRRRARGASRTSTRGPAPVLAGH